jgi:TPR repeat protein
MREDCIRHPTLRASAVALIWLSLNGGSIAATLAEAMAADTRGDYVAEMSIVRPLAEHGDPAAQTRLGDLYLQGLGVAADGSQALQWYAAAADRGDALAMYYLALWDSLVHDDVHAYMWLTLAIPRFSAADADVREVSSRIRPMATAAMSDSHLKTALTLAAAWLIRHPDLPPSPPHIGFPRHQ